jgi:hypothetical protein
MKMYWFERDKRSDSDLAKRANDLESFGFNGVMYPYGPAMGDFFTKISRMMDAKSDFEYIVAIRTYTISPQYLSMICSSINKISPNRIVLNFLTGYVNNQEKKFGGTIEEINDHSSNIERSNYMLNYAKEFIAVNNNGYNSSVDFFVSTTNKEVFDRCAEEQFPILIPYLRYKENWFKNLGQKIILVIAPVIDENGSAADWQCDNTNECRHPEGENCVNLDFFTKDSFFAFLDECKKNGIYGILFQESDYLKEQYCALLPIVKSYINKN